MNDDIILELKDITKTYPGVVALDNLSISFRRGEIHAITGENGAGKSTLIKIITGAIQATSGNLYYQGEELKDITPSKSIDIGIAAIYQEFNLVPHLNVSENVFLGQEKRKGIFLDFKSMEMRTKEILDSLGVSNFSTELVNNLSIGYQQIVEIARALSRKVNVLIMDEPSAPLTNQEVDSMFKTIRNLRDRGVTVIYISHRLEEVFELCDRVTVMRDGKYVNTLNTQDTNRTQLINLMVGRELGTEYPLRKNDKGEEILSVQGLSNQTVKDITFNLKRGEILGFAGLVGAGRTEVARAIFGADPITSGEVRINDRVVKITSPSDAIKAGISLIPEDRKRQGVLLGMSIAHNLTLSAPRKVSKYGVVKSRLENELVAQQITSLRIKSPSITQLVKNLSGGNQQKIVLAKWLLTDCEIIILDEPTRGIDVGAKKEIYTIINELAAKGKAIIMISSEMPELLGMADRILVMHGGKIVGELEKANATQAKILSMAAGGQ